MNACWSADFMSDTLWDGRRFRSFNVVDNFNREGLCIEIDLNLPAARVVRVLDRIAAWRGYPGKLRLDNDLEFIATAMADWVERNAVVLEFIQPGRPMQNGFIERFNGSYRRGILDLYVWFTTPKPPVISRGSRHYGRDEHCPAEAGPTPDLPRSVSATDRDGLGLLGEHSECLCGLGGSFRYP